MAPRLGDWIQVHSGGQFWPLDPRPSEVDIGDIAHALSLVCRFTGHTREFYSVAQHSVLVAITVKRWLSENTCTLCDNESGGAPTRCRDVDGEYALLCDACFEDQPRPEHAITHPLTRRGINFLALAGLLHDGSEAYICDVARPIKMLPAMERYRQAEKEVQACVYQAFGLAPWEPAIVKRADNVLLATEARDLLATLHPEWAIKPPKWPTILERIVPCSPREAERMFLQTFHELKLLTMGEP